MKNLTNLFPLTNFFHHGEIRKKDFGIMLVLELAIRTKIDPVCCEYFAKNLLRFSLVCAGQYYCIHFIDLTPCIL